VSLFVGNTVGNYYPCQLPIREVDKIASLKIEFGHLTKPWV
jgi:hypothetical protein